MEGRGQLSHFFGATMWVPGIELKSSGLATDVFRACAILLAAVVSS